MFDLKKARSLVTAVIASLLLAHDGHSQTFTWTGLGDDNDWSTPENWDGDTVPVAGPDTTLSFGQTTFGEVTNNDIGTFVLNRLEFFVEEFEIHGEPVEFVASSTGEAPVVELFFLQALVASEVVLSADTQIVGANNLLVFRGAITGPGDLLITGDGKTINQVQIQGSHLGTGDVRVLNGGRLEVGGNAFAGIPDSAVIGMGKTIFVEDSEMRLFDCEVNSTTNLIDAELSFGNGFLATSNVVNGDVNIMGNTIFSDVVDTEGGVQGATFNGSFSVFAGNWIVESGVNLFGDSTTVVNAGGELEISGEYVGDTMITVGAELSGVGVLVGGVEVDGLLSPGLSAGTLDIDGSVMLSKTSTTMIEIGGPAATDFDQVNGAAGNIGLLNLGGQLEISFLNDFLPNSNDSFPIFQNYLVSGQFSNVIGGRVFFDEGSFAVEIATGPSADVVLNEFQLLLLGDLNNDRLINLLDVAPFVEALSSSLYLPNADINQDSNVDLLDVAPFVALISTDIIAVQSFEQEEVFPGIRYTDLGDPLVDHDLENNENEPIVNSTTASLGNLGFNARYENTRDSLGLTDGDFVGVTADTKDVNAFTDGIQGYKLSDPDGKLVVEFDEVDLTGIGDVKVSLDYFVNETMWEVGSGTFDLIRIYVLTDVGEFTILDTDGVDIDTLGIEGRFLSGEVTIPAIAQSARLVVSLDGNSTNESVYLDNVCFERVK